MIAQAPRSYYRVGVLMQNSNNNIEAGSRNLTGLRDDASGGGALNLDQSVGRILTPIAITIEGAGTPIVSGFILNTNGTYRIQVAGTYNDWRGSGTNAWRIYKLSGPRAPQVQGYDRYDIDRIEITFATTTTASGGSFDFDSTVDHPSGVFAVGFDMIGGTSQENSGADFTITYTPVT